VEVTAVATTSCLKRRFLGPRGVKDPNMGLAIPLLLLWAFVACYRVKFTFTCYIWPLKLMQPLWDTAETTCWCAAWHYEQHWLQVMLMKVYQADTWVIILQLHPNLLV